MTQTDEREASSSHAESRLGFATLFISSSFPTRLTFRLPTAGLTKVLSQNRTEQRKRNSRLHSLTKNQATLFLSFKRESTKEEERKTKTRLFSFAFIFGVSSTRRR